MTLGEASRLVGKGKTTLTRAIKRGELSATRRADGSYQVDPAELARIYPFKLAHPATPDVANHGAPAGDALVRVASLEAQLDAVRQMLTDLRADRDRWHAQAERLAIAGPRKKWWPWG